MLYSLFQKKREKLLFSQIKKLPISCCCGACDTSISAVLKRNEFHVQPDPLCLLLECIPFFGDSKKEEGVSCLPYPPHFLLPKKGVGVGKAYSRPPPPPGNFVSQFSV